MHLAFQAPCKQSTPRKRSNGGGWCWRSCGERRKEEARRSKLPPMRYTGVAWGQTGGLRRWTSRLQAIIISDPAQLSTYEPEPSLPGRTTTSSLNGGGEGSLDRLQEHNAIGASEPVLVICLFANIILTLLRCGRYQAPFNASILSPSCRHAQQPPLVAMAKPGGLFTHFNRNQAVPACLLETARQSTLTGLEILRVARR